jgi:quinol monooxygenase YgiN
MLVVHVQVQVHADSIEEFKQATLANASASLLEPGVVRFDMIQATDDPTHFVLVEVYRDDDAPAKHKDTAQYATWRDAVLPMMARPRQSRKFRDLFPAAPRWQTPD